MPGENNGSESAGAAMAAEMLKNIVLLNEQLQRNHELYSRLADGVADLIDYHETYMRASEILIEKADEGKSKFSVLDFARAMVEAADEVMGEEEDEPGDEDPRVEIGRR